MYFKVGLRGRSDRLYSYLAVQQKLVVLYIPYCSLSLSFKQRPLNQSYQGLGQLNTDEDTVGSPSVSGGGGGG